MPKLEVGSVGPVVEPGEGLGFVDTAVELEAMGYSAIWLSGPLASREQLAETVRATDRVRVASGIIAVESFRPDDVAAVYSEVEATHPGRLVIGLGGAHGPNPMATRSAYLDRLDQLGVPAERRALAALGPRMVDLARERAAAAYSVLVTPEYTTQLRSRGGWPDHAGGRPDGRG